MKLYSRIFFWRRLHLAAIQFTLYTIIQKTNIVKESKQQKCSVIFIYQYLPSLTQTVKTSSILLQVFHSPQVQVWSSKYRKRTTTQPSPATPTSNQTIVITHRTSATIYKNVIKPTGTRNSIHQKNEVPTIFFIYSGNFIFFIFFCWIEFPVPV